MSRKLYIGELEFCDSAFSLVDSIGIEEALKINYRDKAKEILAYFMAANFVDGDADIKGERLRLLRSLTKLILMEDKRITNKAINA